MALQVIENGESGLAVRSALNGMFAELYAALAPTTPVIIIDMNGNTIVDVSAGTLITNIYLVQQAGTVTLRIGITPNGQEILSDTVINGFQPIQAQQYFQADGTLYFTFSSGSGMVNAYIFYINGLI